MRKRSNSCQRHDIQSNSNYFDFLKNSYVLTRNLVFYWFVCLVLMRTASAKETTSLVNAGLTICIGVGGVCLGELHLAATPTKAAQFL